MQKNQPEIVFKRPFMPPFDEFKDYLDRIWKSGMLTNSGPLHLEFEQALCNYLGVKHICLFANGTLALMIALKAMNLKGEVITTPFTFAATAHAIHWNNLTPVFVDINHDDLNISAISIEKAITPQTVALMPVHIFGNPCSVDQINFLAEQYKLKVIYDAAHCFGVELNGNSVCNAGDFSVLSFHATKVFNSFEGGAIICRDKKTKQYIDALKNNGYGKDQKLSGW